MDNLMYKDIKLQTYLNDSTIYPQLAQNIFKWRTRMVNFKANFKNGNDNISCPLGCGHDDSQDYLLKCEVVKASLKENQTNSQYMDIFSSNCSKIKQSGLLLEKAYKIRESILEKSAL